MPRPVHSPLRAPDDIRLLLADDHAVLRSALRLVLEGQEGISVVGEAATGREAVSATEQLRPDLVLMDLAMPGLNGIESTRRITRRVPQTRVLVLSAYADPARIREAVAAGAAGWVAKHTDVAELLLAVRSIARGNVYFSPSVVSEGALRGLAEVGADRREPTLSNPLSTREREVLQLVGEGYSTPEIAETLVVSFKTVEAHRAHIMAKLNAHNLTDLVRHAMRLGLIELARPEFDRGDTR